MLFVKAKDNRLRKRKLECIASRPIDGYSPGDNARTKKRRNSSRVAFPTFELQYNIRNLKSVVKNILVKTTSPTHSVNQIVDLKGIDMLRGEIGMDAFKNLMQVCDLPHLATEEVFRIFDINQDGTIELKEFLLVSFYIFIVIFCIFFDSVLI